MRFTSESLAISGGTFYRIPLSIVLGAWTHCVWDSFTHRSGWTVERMELLRETAMRVGAAEFPFYHLLQHASTLFGTVVLVCAYLLGLRRQPRQTSSARDMMDDRIRYALFALLLIVALGIGMMFAAAEPNDFTGYLAVRVFVFRTAIYSIALFTASVVPTALVVQAFRSRRRRTA